MDAYTIVWDPETEGNTILIHLIDPYQKEIDMEWVPKSWTERKAELLFRFIGQSLPVGETVNHVHK